MTYHIYEITYISNSVVVHITVTATSIPAAIDELEQTAVIDDLLGISEDDLPHILQRQAI